MATSAPTPIATSTPKKSKIPSLGNPPNAPKKRDRPLWRPYSLVSIPPFPNLDTEEEDEKVWLEQEERRQEMEIEEAIFSDWDIRPKYLYWTPSLVRGVEDLDTLFFLYKKYGCPNSQPRNAEEAAYLSMMTDVIVERIKDLKLHHYETGERPLPFPL